MALYKDGNPVSGLNSIPRLTLAQYNALNVKPEFWVRTDAPESYKKLSADQVSYDSNNTVKDKIDSIGNVPATATNNTTYITDANNKVSIVQIGKLCVISGRFVTTAVKPTGQDPFYTVPRPASGAVIPVANISGIAFIITDDGKLTANAQVATGTYNIMCAYITT